MPNTSPMQSIRAGTQPNGSFDRKLAVICSHDNRQGALPSLMIANAALGQGSECHIFFTVLGVNLVTRQGIRDVTHETSRPRVGLTESIASTSDLEFLRQLELFAAAGGHIWACQLSVETINLGVEQLDDLVEGVISAAEFIKATDHARYVFV
jgi:peroxiredoxin family protein